tara:strand:+ start:79 stop:1986 length:1908 start_codon:yes stop_codon:yes gene_type:complete
VPYSDWPLSNKVESDQEAKHLKEEKNNNMSSTNNGAAFKDKHASLRDIITDLHLPDMQDLAELLYFRPNEGQIWLCDQRMMLMHAEAFGSLRQELIDSFGIDFTRGLMTRVGYLSGTRDAVLAMNARRGQSQLDILSAGAQLHALSGIVQVEPARIEVHPQKGYQYGEFIWKHSLEDEMHAAAGNQQHSACWMETGYSSGFLTQLMGKRILVREVECISSGQSVCRAIAKPVEEWEDAEEDLLYFQPQPRDHLGKQPKPTTATPKRTPTSLLGLEIKPSTPAPLDRPVGGSAAFHSALHKILRVAPTSAAVLLLGESGVGKTMFAHEIHANSRMASGPFIEVNCAAIPDQLIESELFGVQRGAYSGASESRPGRFEAADGGTLFLDEIGTLSMTAQSKLLRVLQSGELERLGSNKTIKVNVRVVTATNEDLRLAVKEERFRSDLFYRLNVFPVTIAPLRERKDDLPLLLENCINRLASRHNRRIEGVTSPALQIIFDHDWPGNIREFENVIERAIILADDGEMIDLRHLSGLDDLRQDLPEGTVRWNARPGIGILLPKASQPAETSDSAVIDVDATLKEMADKLLGLPGFSLAHAETLLVQRALHATGHNAARAAELLGLTRAQIDYRIKKMPDN